jgi:hypothetical protein
VQNILPLACFPFRWRKESCVLTTIELYRFQKRSTKRQSEEELDCGDYIRFDPEASPAYESMDAENVTVEGFGLDIWGAEIKYKPVLGPPCVSVPELPRYPFLLVAALRKIEELRFQRHLASAEVREIGRWLDTLSQEAWSNTLDCQSDHEGRVLARLFPYLHRANFSILTTISQGPTSFDESNYDKA